MKVMIFAVHNLCLPLAVVVNDWSGQKAEGRGL